MTERVELPDGSAHLAPGQYRRLRVYLAEWDEYAQDTQEQLVTLDDFWREAWAAEARRADVACAADVAVAEDEADAWKARLAWAGIGAGGVAVLVGGVVLVWAAAR